MRIEAEFEVVSGCAEGFLQMTIYQLTARTHMSVPIIFSCTLTFPMNTKECTSTL
jgi:hypothetical protein